MSERTASETLTPLLERMHGGDLAARDELLRHARGRLLALTRRVLGDFERLRQWEQSEDVLQGASLRLLRALEEVKPRTTRDFLGLAALHIRRELLDLARRHYGRGADRPVQQVAEGSLPEGAETTLEPGRVAAWTEFHRQVDALPPEEREVVDLLWYQELPQAEAAALLEVDPSTVKRRWRAARLKLAAALRGWLPDAPM
jgi:RNA polymerase sigma-70 factor (ECF subfamily)